ncbi:MAG: phenylalanine--tRNA ligase subunit alpha [bacterium JZ-2024 1]
MNYLEQMRSEALREIEQASSLSVLERVKSRWLGRKGEIRKVVQELSSLPLQERKMLGARVNALKEEIEFLLEERRRILEEQEEERQLAREKIDVSLPGIRQPMGRPHLLSRTLSRIIRIFLNLGFDVVDGPEIESEENNFDALNIPWWHPVRDVQDSFYLSRGVVLRTQTSPVQIRVMRERKPPLRIVSPGRTYRRDAFDARHSPVFHQIEGLMVDEPGKVTFADLKGILTIFCRELFGEGIALRFRPSYFPFTEPSAELDISCLICGGHGCSVCEYSGWLEVLGAGMVHPRVFVNVGYDPKSVQGFAFGMGLERITMLLFRIHDIRLFYENDMRFLSQFPLSPFF